MNHPKGCFQGFSNSRLVATLFLCLLAGNSTASERQLDAAPHGFVGAGVGFSIQAGRTEQVDGVTGATIPDNAEEWLDPAFSSTGTIDLGLPTSDFGADGTIGLRLSWLGAFPTKGYGLNVMARYRLAFPTGNPLLRSVEPWLGMGIGFHFTPEIVQGVYFQFPVAVGLDLQLGKSGLYFTTVIEVNTFNPFGPSQTATVEGESIWSRYRYDSYMIATGLAFRFY